MRIACRKKHFFCDLCSCHTKRRIGESGPANPSFGMTNYRFVICSLYKAIPNEGLMVPCPPTILLVWQWQKFKKAQFCGPQLSVRYGFAMIVAWRYTINSKECKHDCTLLLLSLNQNLRSNTRKPIGKLLQPVWKLQNSLSRYFVPLDCRHW